MATFTKTVDPNGGADYLSIALWEAGEQALYSSGDIARAVCKRTGVTKDTSSTTIFGWTTGVIPEVTVDPLYRHEGKIADTRVSDGNYIYIVTNGSAANFRPAEPNILIDGLLIQPTSNQVGIQNAGGNLNDISKNWYVRSCIVDGGTESTGRGIDNSSGASTLYAQNSIVTNFDGAAVGYAISAQNANRRVYVQNCTLFKNRYGCIALSSAQLIAQNTIALDNFAGDYLSADALSDYNVSSDASAPGTNSATLKTSYATYFFDHLNGDFHLNDASGTLFGLASVDLSATFTGDIDGDTRPSDSTFGLGADYYVAAGGGAFTLTADSGTYTVSGTSATLAASKIMAADSGIYSYTGTAAELNKGFSLTADSGAYSYIGAAANLVFASVGNFTLSADTGSYDYTGTAANLALSAILNADSGAYSYAGSAATLTRGFSLTANSGTYSYTGAAVDFSRNYVIGAESGIYSYNGSIASLIFAGIPPDIPIASGVTVSSRLGDGVSISATFGSGATVKGNL